MIDHYVDGRSLRLQTATTTRLSSGWSWRMAQVVPPQYLALTIIKANCNNEWMKLALRWWAFSTITVITRMKGICCIINFLPITSFCKERRSGGRAKEVLRLAGSIDASQIRESDSSFDCYWLLFLDRRLLSTCELIRGWRTIHSKRHTLHVV